MEIRIIYSFTNTNGGSGVRFDSGVFTNTFVTNNTFTGADTAIGAYNFSGSDNVFSFNTMNDIGTGLDMNGSNASFVHNTIHGYNSYGVANDTGTDLLVLDNVLDSMNQSGYGVALSNTSSSTVQNNQILNVNTGFYGNNIEDTRLINNMFSTSTGDMISITNVTGGLAVASNTVMYPTGLAFILSNADGRVSGNTLTLTGNDFQSNVYPFAIQSVHNATTLHNTFRGPVWVYDDTPGNIYNDASTGNAYYSATSTPAYTIFNILDGDGNGYADQGTDLPFSSTTAGTTFWPQFGQDAHPATTVTPPPTIIPIVVHHSSRNRSQTHHQNDTSTNTTEPTDITTPSTTASTNGICTPYLTSYIQPGVANDPDQVKKLQTFLNTHEGEKLTVDGTYKQADIDAVKRFQQKYASEILGVWGLSAPTGYVYRTTLLKINSFYCSATISCPFFKEFNDTNLNSSTEEVGKTKELLKELGFYTGAIDNTFDASLKSSLSNFQQTFSQTMLKPWGLSSGTGYKYKTTNKFLNMLVGCKTPAVDLDGKGTFDY